MVKTCERDHSAEDAEHAEADLERELRGVIGVGHV
jgi:hypothetical protein